MEKNIDYFMSLPYPIEIASDEEEGGVALYCPDLPGCITCAETAEEGFAMIEDAKKSWLLACIKDGVNIPEPSGGKTSTITE